jgi:hypothetical protein
MLLSPGGRESPGLRRPVPPSPRPPPPLLFSFFLSHARARLLLLPRRRGKKEETLVFRFLAGAFSSRRACFPLGLRLRPPGEKGKGKERAENPRIPPFPPRGGSLLPPLPRSRAARRGRSDPPLPPMRSRGKEVPPAYFPWRIRQKGGEAAQEPASSSMTPQRPPPQKKKAKMIARSFCDTGKRRTWSKTGIVAFSDPGGSARAFLAVAINTKQEEGGSRIGDDEDRGAEDLPSQSLSMTEDDRDPAVHLALPSEQCRGGSTATEKPGL